MHFRINSLFSIKTVRYFLGAVSLLCCSANGLLAQRVRITEAIDNARRVRLNGLLHPLAKAEFDRGPVASSLPLGSLNLTLRLSASQQTGLEQLLAAQQDPSSPDYHRWLTPEEYADRFGASSDDISKLTQWLGQQGFHVTGVARARNWISFSGTAGQVASAFGTEIHRYQINSETHFANATEPTIPEAFSVIVRGIRGLSDFRMKPLLKPRVSSMLTAPRPAYTSSSGNHYLSPDDFASIYDLSPLYNAGINGGGQKLVVAGQTQINISDIEQFRTQFNLPANDPQVMLVPNTRDPGISSDDLPEADLDLELSGAVARNASITFLYSDDVMNAVQYAIDQNLAPVLSLSYGSCETETPTSDAITFQSWAQQGNAEGITWVAASGDSGGADCIAQGDDTGGGPSVDVPASIPEVTGLGGSEFNEGVGQYWSASNNVNGGSALSYIPEVVWNDSSPDNPSAGGGGASVLFLKPSWQTGAGVPNDNARDVPDVSLAASPEHDGFIVYTGGQRQIYGGTSVASPSFAGIATLLNQYLVSNGVQASPGLGNMNPKLYALAQTAPGAFHDINTG
ncbi:MAG TPA: S53 family peptidase, partial [Bryobacteraceae bacterium]|nr:S53 family peptidase [Bryobacteraceae bacterium]